MVYSYDILLWYINDILLWYIHMIYYYGILLVKGHKMV